MRGKLNEFQKNVLRWNRVHPYNAVHAVRIPRPLDQPRLIETINGELESLGLTGLVIDRRRYTFEYGGGPARNELKTIDGGNNLLSVLSREFELQLNTAFQDDGAINPFRFFAIREDDGFSLGLTYFHVIAGAEAIILLMKRLIGRYTGEDLPGFSAPLDLYPKGDPIILRLYPTLLFRKLASYASTVPAMRQASKPRYQDFRNPAIGVRVFSLSAKQFETLRGAAKRWGVTVNDLFLALLMNTLSPFAAKRFSATRRRNLSVGSIVNTRRDLGFDPFKTFGLFLGSFVVSHPVPEEMTVENLAREIHNYTDKVKRARAYLGTPVDLWLGRVLASVSSASQEKSFYAKANPLWGGVTNMNVNTLWEQREGGCPIDYFRAVSTGPITPLVLAPTTVGDVVNIGLSYRKTVFSENQMGEFVPHFEETIKQIEVVS